MKRAGGSRSLPPDGRARRWTGLAPQAVVIGNLNSDPSPDLAVANSGSNSASVLLGNGDGTFGLKTDFAVEGNPQSLAIGDLNGDGKADLAVGNAGSNTVSILLGGGDGTFAPEAAFQTGPGPSSIGLADLDGDGKLDVASANAGSNTVSVLLGDGGGALGTKTDFGTGSAPSWVALGDLTGDGKPDLAVANRKSNSVSVLVNSPAGLFAPVALSTEVGSGEVTITWHVPTASGLAFRVYRRTADTDWAEIGVAGRASSEVVVFTDAQVHGGTRYGYRLLANQLLSDEVWVLVGESGAPSVLRLGPGAPNPFVARTQLSYGVPAAGHVRLEIFDVQGRRVATVVDQVQAAGWRAAGWDGRDARGRMVASGTYFARLESDGKVEVRKLVMAR